MHVGHVYRIDKLSHGVLPSSGCVEGAGHPSYVWQPYDALCSHREPDGCPMLVIKDFDVNGIDFVLAVPVSSQEQLFREALAAAERVSQPRELIEQYLKKFIMLRVRANR